MTAPAGLRTIVLAMLCAAAACRAAQETSASTAGRSSVHESSAPARRSSVERPQAPGSAGASGDATEKLDMEAIFPPGDGRDLVLNNCLTCHSFVRFVLLQRTPEQWTYTRRTMRPLVPHLGEAEVERLFGYLERHFNDHTPVPDLPEWFLRSFVW